MSECRLGPDLTVERFHVDGVDRGRRCPRLRAPRPPRARASTPARVARLLARDDHDAGPGRRLAMRRAHSPARRSGASIRDVCQGGPRSWRARPGSRRCGGRCAARGGGGTQQGGRAMEAETE